MIERRVQGIANMFVWLQVVTACLAWLIVHRGFELLRGAPAANLLSDASYLIAITVGMLTAWRPTALMGSKLMELDWAGSLRLAMRQIAGIVGAVFTLVVVFKDPGISRTFLGYYIGISFLTLATANRTLPRYLAGSIFHRKQRARVLLAGRTAGLGRFDEWVKRQRFYGTEVVGWVEFPSATLNYQELDRSPPRFGNVAEAIEQTQPDQIFVLAIEPPTGAVRELMARAHKAGCNVYLYNDYAERLGIPLQPVSFDGQPFLVVGDEPLEDPFNRTLKRTLDLVLTIPLLVLLPPVALAVALAQKLQSPGPLLFRQKRSGLRGRNFTILKFRTMDTTGGRIYPLGAFLRRTSLDELPQLFNVLMGDMSLVGPRPHIVKDDVTFGEQAEIYRMRFFAKPGITGLAQSRGFRGEVFEPKLIQERLELDLLYIRSWSLWLDIAIMARTIREVFLPPPSAK